MKKELKGWKEKMSKMVEKKEQALLYIKRPGIYTCDPSRGVLLHASIERMGIHFWRKGAT